MPSRGIPAVVFGFLLFGCGPGLPNDQVWRSDHFRYHSRSCDAFACQDLLGSLEQHRKIIQQASGVVLADSAVIDYYKFRDQADIQANGDCSAGVACSPHWAVESAAPMDTHELIHAYLTGSGFPPWLFVEGAAVAFSCQVPLRGRPTIPSWRDALTLSRDDAELYAAGGWLTADLVARYGPELYFRLYSVLPHGGDAQNIATSFQSIYGVDLDQAWSDATARDAVPPSCPWECSNAPLDGSSVGEMAPVCGLDHIQRTFNVPTASTAFALTETGPSSVSVGTCSGDNDPIGGAEIPARSDGMTVSGFLGAGSYFLSFDPVRTEVTLSLGSAAPEEMKCESTTWDTTNTRSITHVVVPRKIADAYVGVSGPLGNVEIQTYAMDPGTQVELCTSCAKDACTSIVSTQISSVTLTGPYIVHVIPGARERPFVTTTIRTAF